MVTLGLEPVKKSGSCLDSGLGVGEANLMQCIRNLLGIFALSIGLLLVQEAHSESVTKFVTTEEKIREEMIVISRELGVTCNECHNVQNFKSDTKKSFKVSLEHMKLTRMLSENGLDGKKGPKATCYMCHRGKLMPEYKEPQNSKVVE